MTPRAAPGSILVTGGEGALAGELLRLDPGVDAPPRSLLDVSSEASIERYCADRRHTVIIHAAAVTNRFAEDVDEEYLRSNIIGTANVVLWARRRGLRLVYVSTDYVYPGERGGYTEDSVLLPVNRYAASKLGGEMAVRLYDNSLIVRTSFYRELPFARSCVDQFTSRIPIAEAARAVYALACRPEIRGVVNVGTPARRSLHDIVRAEFNPATEPIRRADIAIAYRLPPDTSMDTSHFHRIMQTDTTASRHVAHCRVCGSGRLHPYLDLGRTPLANSYIPPGQAEEPEYTEELAIQLCLDCGLSQLTRVVHPDLMFRNYLYVSSTTRTFREHCSEMAATTIAAAGAAPGELVLDIASNDGCLLARFREQGMNIVGVDPAENLAAEANAAGIPTLCTYWSPAVARDLAARFGRPKIVTATNVFAHVDDVRGFVAGVKECLADRGMFVIECPYLVDFIEKNEFDTAYHEHLSYFAVRPLTILMEQFGMAVFNVEFFPDLHGGTIRTYVCRKGDYPEAPAVAAFLEAERAFGLLDASRYDEFAARVRDNKARLRAMIAALRAEGKTVWAYGASAKGNTLMNYFELTARDIPVVIDDNPKKWGFLAPGSRMRITGIQELSQQRVDCLVLLAWNFQREIVQRCAAAGYRGSFLVPVPVATVIPPPVGPS